MSAFKGLGTYGNGVGVVTPLDHHLANSALVAKLTGNAVRPGLFWSGTATIVSGTAGMAYSVAAYTCATSRGASAGTVIGGNDGTLSVATTAAPGSNSRYDVVYHWHREYSLDGVDSNPVIGVIQGTAAASPTVPSLAAFPGAIALAQILVPAGVTATNTGTTITQLAPFTSVAGGLVVARTTTERDLYTPAAADVTARCFVIADGITYKWNGTVWKAWETSVPVAFTPTTTGLTLGSGTLSFSYVVDAGVYEVYGTLLFGNTSTMTGLLTFSLPATLNSIYEADASLGVAKALVGGTNYPIEIWRNASTNTVTPYVKSATGTYVGFVQITNTVPPSFALGSIIAVRARFLPA